MFRKLFNHLGSRRFKSQLYAGATLSIVGYVIYLAFTIHKPFIKPTRAETAGYEGYDDDWYSLITNPHLSP